MLTAGLAYLIDALNFITGVPSDFSFAEFAFFGEVVLLIWLIGWGGRSPRDRAKAAR